MAENGILRFFMKSMHKRIGRRLFKKLFFESGHADFRTLIELEALNRPAHAYCIWGAVDLARRLGVDEISVIEFGVAGGRSLLVIEAYAARLERESGIKVEVYGFDTAEGLPRVQDHRDLPHWFAPGQYVMDFETLQSKLKRAKLIIGNIEDTIDDFCEKHDPAPLGALFCDVDLYSSTKSVLRIFDQADRFLMPRIFIYMDDVIGSHLEMNGKFNGEELAINEFNQVNDNNKIHLNSNLLSSRKSFQRQIYYFHHFGHDLYNNYIGGEDQERMMSLLKTPRSDPPSDPMKP